MMLAILFWLLLASASITIAINGTRSSRTFLAIIVAAAAATAVVDVWPVIASPEKAYFAVNTALLIVALIYVWRLDVFWPLWFAGFQTITVAGDIGRLVSAGTIPSLYTDLSSFWAVPALLSMAVGTLLDRRRGLNGLPQATQ